MDKAGWKAGLNREGGILLCRTEEMARLLAAVIDCGREGAISYFLGSPFSPGIFLI